MKNKDTKKGNNKHFYIKTAVSGLAAGLVNGFFGAGGGLILVPLLKKLCNQKTATAHSTSVAVILPLCVAGYFIYSSNITQLSYDALPFIIGGVLSAPLGALFLKKLSPKLLKKLFGAFMIFCAVRMIIFN